jgi:hypothetical protein
MSAYRRNFIPDPIATRRDALYIGIPMLACTVAVGLAVYAFIVKADVRPIATPAVVARPLPALGVIEPPLPAQRLVDVRTEAFRAGLLEGLAQQCGMQPLAAPIHGQ